MSKRHDGGKGDRPILPKNQEKFDSNWDNIFKKPKTGPCQNHDKESEKIDSYPSEIVR